MMLYRSPGTRWVLSAVGVWIGCMLIFGGPKWRSAPSLHWLARVPIPLSAWGVLLIVYALMLFPQRCRPLGFALGAALFAVFTVALLATVSTAGPKSAIVIGGLIDLTAFHAYAVKTSLAADWAERGQL